MDDFDRATCRMRAICLDVAERLATGPTPPEDPWPGDHWRRAVPREPLTYWTWDGEAWVEDPKGSIALRMS